MPKENEQKSNIEGMESQNQNLKWYFKSGFIIVAFLCVGPLALPLVWFHPRLNPVIKLAISIVVIALSYYFWIVSYKSLKTILNFYQMRMLP